MFNYKPNYMLSYLKSISFYELYKLKDIYINIHIIYFL